MKNTERIIKIKKGLNIPIVGEPNQIVTEGNKVTKVALLGEDYIGLRPKLCVEIGSFVKEGSVIFLDKSNVRFTSPLSGKVIAINRGEKRRLLSVVIEISGNESETFNSFSRAKFLTLSPEEIKENLLMSGLWTAIRTRPFSHIPNPQTKPDAIFVSALDTNPLSANPEIVLENYMDDFIAGLEILSRLGKLFLCHNHGTRIPIENLKFLESYEIQGPHPAGLVGTQIHFIFPVSRKRTVWHVGYEDVVAIGKLFLSGKLFLERIISLAGSQVKNPRLIKTRIGASITELIRNELKGDIEESRVISGSVLHGRIATNSVDFLGRYHLQISVIPEGTSREFLNWLKPGFNKFSIKGVYFSKFFPFKKYIFSTTTNGSSRAMVPIGMYEKVFPLRMLPTFLLRSLIVEDIEQAEALGCLELDEEDLALCTFVCPGKYDYGPILRKNLTRILKESL